MHFQLKQSVFKENILRDGWNSLAPRVKAISLRRSLKENRNDQNRKNVDDLDHRIDRWARGIFVRIADGVAGNCRLMREGTFASKIAFLDELLGIVPRAAAGGHGY